MLKKDKVFYWIKLKSEFLNGETIDFLMSQKGGANYVVLYQMLIMKTINTSGKLCNEIGEVIIPFDADKIQRDCKWFDIDTVKIAMNLYSKLGMIYKNEDGVFQITGFEQLVGSETYWAQQKRKKLNENNTELKEIGKSPTKVQFPLISNILNSNISNSNNNITNNTSNNIYSDNIEGGKNSTKERFKKPTVEEVKEYCLERKNNVNAENFIDFYESKGWKIGKNSMKDWRACVRTWERSSNNNVSGKKEVEARIQTREYDKEKLNGLYDSLEDVEI